MSIDKFLRSSKAGVLDRFALTVHGPPKSGKTLFAATASVHFPDELGEVATLDDMIWVSFDAGALDGFASLGLEVPNELDAVGAFSELGVADGTREMLNMLGEIVEPHMFVVCDTISMFDRYLSDFYEPRSKDNFVLFRNILNAHKRWYTGLIGLGCRLIFLCHSKVGGIVDDDKAKLDKAAKSAGPADIFPDITGQARTIYIGNSGIEGALLKTTLPGKKGESARKFYPMGGKGFEGGNRWEHLLNPVEEPNIRALMNRIEGKKE